MKVTQAAPNAGHVAIADFVRNNSTKRVDIITQNVDDLHGSIRAPRCFACERPANAALIEAIPNEPEGGRRLAPPRCDHCNGTPRPGVVWFGESLPQAEFKHASTVARDAEVFIVIGTSGVVEPAASLVRVAGEAGAFIISIDPNETMTEGCADVAIRDTAAAALPIFLKV